MPRIYLDNAATSWPKPPVVYEAIDRYQREIGATAGRGAYDSAGDAQRVLSRARAAVARLVGANDPAQVVFTAGGTESLNLAIFGSLEPGDHVVTTVCEHNSVLRPLAALRSTHGVQVDYADGDAGGRVASDSVLKLIRPTTRLVVMSSASNVTGAIQPVREVGLACRDLGVGLLVDAAQSLGHEAIGHAAIDLQADGVSMLAAPGHKGLLGPLGVGVLVLATEWTQRLRPLHFGGSGSNSDEETPPLNAPDRYEAGNLNVPALAGLAAGLDWLSGDESSDHSTSATRTLLAGLHELPAATVYGPTPPAPRAPVVSFNIDGYDPQEVAAILASAGVEARAGLHCSPRMHRSLGTFTGGGTVRLSPGFQTTDADIETALELIRQIAITC
ncbi:MAG: aminotransferase class V-fold PLP-dependent enzyme [Planctomycetota bacterium]